MLQVWLPFINNLNNQGLSDTTIANNGATVSTSGKIGSCYSFDGNDDFISIDCPDLYRTFSGGSQPFSIAFWIYHADSTRGVIFGDYGLSGGINFNIELSANHHIRYYWNGHPDKTFVNTPLEINVWTHIVLTYDGNKICVYKNGLLQADTYAGTLIQRTKNSGLFYLGRDSRTGATALNGRINDFRIYSHCLSPIECKKISSALVLHYPLAMPGGENLMPNSLQMQLGSASPSTGTWRIAGSSTMTKSRVQIDDITYGFQNVGIQTVNDGSCYGIDSFPMVGNTQYTISFDARIIDGTEGYAGFYIASSTINGGSYTKVDKNYYVTPLTKDWTRCWVTFTTNATANRNIYIGITTGDTSVTTQMCRVKLELGSRATPWTPNPADDEYAAMGYDDNIEYDVSGYGYNGIHNNVAWSGDSPRYNGCYELNGTNSYIRIDSGNWKVMGAEELTVNEWAYADDWATQTNAHLWSCTESGGFNTENGEVGKLRFPVHVYTNADKTTHDYINVGSGESTIGTARVGTATIANNVVGFVISDLAPGWHMFTGVYNTSGIKTYIDGVLKESVNFTSYGIYYSNATLFLGAESTGVVSCKDPYFNGKLSDFRMYYTALSDSDILALYNTPISLSNTGTLLTQGELSEV